jgi:hypothetical protein
VISVPIVFIPDEYSVIPQAGRQQVTFALQLIALHTPVLQYDVEGVCIRGNGISLRMGVPDVQTVLCLYPVDMAKG